MKYDNDFYVTAAKVGKPAPKFEMDAVMPTGDFLDRFGKVNLDELRGRAPGAPQLPFH